MSWELEDTRSGILLHNRVLSPRIVLLGSLNQNLSEKEKERFDLIRSTQGNKEVEVIVCLTAGEIRDLQNGLLRKVLALPGEAWKVAYKPEDTVTVCTRLSRDWVGGDGSNLL